MLTNHDIMANKKKKSKSVSKSKSWRDLPQSRSSKSVTPQARQRQRLILYRMSFALAGFALFAALACAITYQYIKKPSIISFGGPSYEISNKFFRTDGVLTHDWMVRCINLPSKSSLMDVDIHAIEARLESQGQVAHASVKRIFPDAILVEIQERKPILRIRVSKKGSGHKDYLLGNDGTIFSSASYPDNVYVSLSV